MSQASSSKACIATDFTLPANSLDTFTANVDASCFVIHSGVEIVAGNESLVGHGGGGEMIHSAKDEVNIAKDPGLWLDISADDVAYWTACGPSDCQQHFGSGKPVRNCLQKLFVGTKANGEKYKGEWLLYSPSTGSVLLFRL